MATAAQIREHYDSLAFVYRTFWGDHIHHGLFTDEESPAEAQVKMLEHCIELLDLRGGEQVFDVGCGHGGTLLHLATTRNCRGTGLTLSPKQARIARENAAGFANDLSFIVDDADSFDFPKSAADLVWVMESSEHFADKARFFRNVKQMLRPSGQLLLAAWTGSMESARVREVARAFLCPVMWSAAEYRAAIEATGMQIKHFEDLTPQIIRTWEVCQKSARLAAPAVKLLPRAAREFIEGIDIILDAYRSGDLSYSVIVANLSS